MKGGKTETWRVVLSAVQDGFETVLYPFYFLHAFLRKFSAIFIF